MGDRSDQQRLTEALEDLQRYLSDSVAPLLVVDSLTLLLAGPPDLVAHEIEAWAARQFRAHGGSLPLSDFLFHAVKKLHLMAELRLVPEEPLEAFLGQLKVILVGRVPAAEGDVLRANLERMRGGSRSSLTPAVDLLFRQEGPQRIARQVPAGAGGPARAEAGASEGPPAAALTEEVVRGLRRFSLLLERLEASPGLAGGGPARAPQDEEGLRTQLLAAAAENARSPTELRQYLDHLQEAGIKATDTAEIFRALSRNLPDWIVPGADQEGAPPPGSAAAMRRLVTLSQDPAEGAQRFQEMIKAAIEQFNAGALARAVTIFELADRIVAEGKVDLATANLIRGSVHGSLDPDRLRIFSQEEASQDLLRKVLRFFPGLGPGPLVEELETEGDRQRRRLLLALLEVHGAAARPLLLDRLESSFGATLQADNWHLQRNLVYLLRRIAPPGKGPDEREVAMAVGLSALHHPTPLVREAIAYLGQLPDERAEQALLARLGEAEAQLAAPDSASQPPADLERILQTLTSNLARFGTSASRRAVVEHGLRRQPHLGDTVERLAELRGVDLSSEPDLVARLVEVLRSRLPMKVFGFVVHKDPAKVHSLIEALSGTRSPEVEQLFAEIVERYPDQEFTQMAATALKEATAPVLPAPDQGPAIALEGDLEFFGIPNLLQTLTQNQLSGILTLRDRSDKLAAAILVRQGLLCDCRVGVLRGETALYQLLEQPFSGTFHFENRPPEKVIGTPAEILPLLMEGMRRYDELQRARAEVPDDARLVPTGGSPTPMRGETDGAFVHSVWSRLKEGATPREIQERVFTDAYRIRALISHWVEERSLRILKSKDAAPPAEP